MLAHIARYLNGFIVIGILLVIAGVGGLMTNNRLLTEPGQPVNPSSWLLYFGAAALMIVNGIVSIRLAALHAQEGSPDEPEAKDAEARSSRP